MSPMVPQPGVAWRLPEITQAEYDSLEPHGRKLQASQLADWNRHAETDFAANVMRSGLISLISIVEQA